MSQSPQFLNEFLFLRHGQTDWNALGRLQGRSDRPLDATGQVQAQACAKLLAKENIGAIVSSPLLRAWQTAHAVSEAIGVPVMKEPNLMERSFGSLEGRMVHEILSDRTTGLDVASSTTLPPDAEPWEDLCKRTTEAITHWLLTHPAKRILFVSHYGVISAICQQFCSVSEPAKNATPYRFVRNRDSWDMTEVDGT